MPLGIVSGRGVKDDSYKRPDILDTGSLNMEVGNDDGLKLQGRGGTRDIIIEGSTTEEVKRWHSFFASWEARASIAVCSCSQARATTNSLSWAIVTPYLVVARALAKVEWAGMTSMEALRSDGATMHSAGGVGGATTDVGDERANTNDGRDYSSTPCATVWMLAADEDCAGVSTPDAATRTHTGPPMCVETKELSM
jgi:hypothetical protein